MSAGAFKGLVSLVAAAMITLLAIKCWPSGFEKPGMSMAVPAVILFIIIIMIFWVRRKAAELSSRLRLQEDALERLDAAFYSPEVDRTHGSSIPNYRPAAAFAPIATVMRVRHLTLTVIDNSQQAIIDHFSTNPADMSFSAVDALELATRQNSAGPFKAAPDRLVSPRQRQVERISFDNLVAVITYRPLSNWIMRAHDHDFLFMRGAVRRFLHNIHAERQDLELRTTVHKLEHSERLAILGTVTAGLAHEFNNILTAIQGFADRGLISLSKKATDIQLENILESTQRATIIIDQILTMSRKRNCTTKPISLAEVMRASEALIRISVPSRIMLDISVLDKVNIDSNPVAIQQMLMNLCRNSWQSIASSGKIEIVVAQDEVSECRRVSTGVMPPGRYAKISVVDTGAGIPETAVDNIFSPFFTTKAPTGGTGLGLSTVLRQVTALGGFINVSSVVGAGTRFDIAIPLSTRPPVELASFFSADHVPLGKGEIVAILCRDRDAREMYEDKIAALGYEPFGFESNEKYQCWSGDGNREDVVLADIGPDLEMQHFLRCLHPESVGRLILIGSTGLSEHLGHADYLEKPLSSQALADALSRRVNPASFPAPDPL